MKRSYPVWLALLFAVVLLASPATGTPQCENDCMHPEELDEAITFELGLTSTQPYYRCGEEAELSISDGYDCDCVWDPCPTPPCSCMDDLAFSGWPGPAPQRNAEDVYAATCKVSSDEPGAKPFPVTANDPDPCGNDDPPVTRSLTVTWVGVGSVEGPGTVCVGVDATYNAESTVYDGNTQTDPCSTWLMWSGGGTPASGTGASFTTHWDTPGEYTISAGIGTCMVSKEVHVVGPTGFEDLQPGGGFGGCSSCASSTSSGFAPMPSLFNDHMNYPMMVPGQLGGPGLSCCGGGCGEDTGASNGDDPVGGSADDGGRNQGTMGVLKCLGAPADLGQYYDAEGKSHTGSIPTTSNSLPADWGDGLSLKKNADGTVTLRDWSGASTTFDVPAAGVVFQRIRRVSTTDPQGRVTTFTRSTAERALESVTLPTGEVWGYGHGPGDTKITSVTAPNDVTTTIGYVTSGKAVNKVSSVTVRDSGSNVLYDTAYSYDNAGRVQSVTKAGDRRITYGYGADTITVTEQTLDTTPVTISQVVYQYGSDWTTVTRKDVGGTNDQTTRYTFYTSGGKKRYVQSVTDPMNNTTTYTVTTSGVLSGKVTAVEDALHRTTNYSYNPTTGLLETVTYPGSYTEVYTYYADSPYVKTVKNIRGNYTLYVRASGSRWKLDAMKVHAPIDDNGQLRAPTDQEWDQYAPIRQYSYHSETSPVNGLRGMLYQETVPAIEGTSAKVTEYGYYESDGTTLRPSPTTVTYEYWNGSAYASGMERTVYNNMGHALSATDANSRSITYTYDAQGRQLTTTYATGRHTESSYDCCSLLWTRDENGNYSHYAYDAAKRVTDTWVNTSSSTTPPATPLVHYTYDGLGNVHTVTTYSDASTGRTTTYTYDDSNRVTAIDHPSPLGDEAFGYDAVGNLWWKTDGVGTVTLYRYDDLNRLINVYYDYTGALPPTSYPTSADVTYTYYGGSRLRDTMVDSTGTSDYDYDIQDRLTSYIPPQPASRTITYTYNNLGQKTSISNGSFQVYYDYFKNGWLKEVRLGTSSIAGYVYDAVGNRTRVNLGNATYTTYSYDSDPRYRLSGIMHMKQGTPPSELLAISYPSRDGAGNPERMLVGTDQTDYTYDMYNRLETVTYPEPQQVAFGYDWVGNRLNPPANPNPMEYNAADQLTRWPGNHTYTHYSTGSIYEQWDDGMTSLQKTYQYTPANLLSSVVHEDVAGDPASTMAWDADGNRISFTSSTGGTWQFVYDTTAGIPAVIEEIRPTGSAHYIREPNGELIARISGTTGQVHRYYHFDELGSTRLLTDASGTVTDTFNYDAWGKLIAHTGSNGQPYLFVGRLGYHSHYQDANLFTENGWQLLQLGVRFYDVEIGRFTQVDAASSPGRPYSSYAYADDLPNMLVDPNGLYPTFAWAKSCEDRLPKPVRGLRKRQAEAYLRDVESQYPAGNLAACGYNTITVECSDDMGSTDKGNPVCGKTSTSGPTITISLNSLCPSAYCIMLHEAIHVCSGPVAPGRSGCWGVIRIPGCGNISGQHT